MHPWLCAARLSVDDDGWMDDSWWRWLWWKEGKHTDHKFNSQTIISNPIKYPFAICHAHNANNMKWKIVQSLSLSLVLFVLCAATVNWRDGYSPIQPHFSHLYVSDLYCKIKHARTHTHIFPYLCAENCFRRLAFKSVAREWQRRAKKMLKTIRMHSANKYYNNSKSMELMVYSVVVYCCIGLVVCCSSRKWWANVLTKVHAIFHHNGSSSSSSGNNKNNKEHRGYRPTYCAVHLVFFLYCHSSSTMEECLFACLCLSKASKREKEKRCMLRPFFVVKFVRVRKVSLVQMNQSKFFVCALLCERWQHVRIMRVFHFFFITSFIGYLPDVFPQQFKYNSPSGFLIRSQSERIHTHKKTDCFPFRHIFLFSSLLCRQNIFTRNHTHTQTSHGEQF